MQTGWGRTGDHFWGWQAHDAAGPPDILTFAKGIGNGMSIGGVVARAEVMNCLDANSISTFGGSPVTMAAGLANLAHLLEHDLQGNARRVGGLLVERLRAARAGLDVVREVRGRGLMIGIELVDPGTDDPVPGGGLRRAGGRPRGRPAHRQGRRPLHQQRAAHRTRRSPSPSPRRKRAPRSSNGPCTPPSTSCQGGQTMTLSRRSHRARHPHPRRPRHHRGRRDCTPTS